MEADLTIISIYGETIRDREIIVISINWNLHGMRKWGSEWGMDQTEPSLFCLSEETVVYEGDWGE